MKTTDFNKAITSAQLKEDLEKRFGARVNLAKYDREQLEDIRNKLRTRIFQQEGAAGINDLLTNETYQKDKAMLDLLNTRIKEMLGEQMQQLRDRMDQLSEAKKGVRDIKHAKKAKGSKPDFLDLDKDGNKAEPMKSAAKSAKVKETIKKDEKELEGNAFGQAVRNAKKDGIQPGEKVKVGGKEYPVKEGFPTVDDAKKAAAGTAGMKAGEKKKSSTGGEITKTATGLKHTAGKNYGGKDAPKTPDSDKKMKEGKAHPNDCDCKECMGMYEGDMGKHNNKTTGFKALAKKAGGGEKGQKIAGAQFQKMKKAGQLEESNFKHNVRFVNESLQFLLSEDEEGKAKAITAAGDMVNDYTSWMQRVGQYQTKSMIELADSIKADFGQAESEAFKAAVAPALSATLEVLTQQRETISAAVAALAGGGMPEEPMGMEPGMPPEDGMDMSAPDEMNPMPAGDEFGAADAAAGGPETSGRAMRESKFARKLAESHSIMSKLAK